MKTKDFIAPIAIIIGGFLSILAVLPGVSDFLPIEIINYSYIYTNGGKVTPAFVRIYNPHFYITFWGFNVYSNYSYKPSSQYIQPPHSWTSLAISPIVMVLIFVVLGSLALTVAIKPSIKIAQVEVPGLTCMVLGIIEQFILILIFSGNRWDLYHFGLSDPIETGNVRIGLGYWILVVSALLITIGGALNFFIKQKAEYNEDNIQKESLPFISYIGAKFKSNISRKEYPVQLSERTMNKMEELERENKLEEEK